MIRASVLSGDSAGRYRIIRRLEAAGIDVVGEGRTAADGRRLARGCEVIVIDGDADLVDALLETVQRPLVTLQRAVDPRDPPPQASTTVLPWPSTAPVILATLQEALVAPGPMRPEDPPARPDVVDADPVTSPAPPRTRPRIIAIGASAGGPAALATVLGGLISCAVPVVVAQHLHRDFVGSLRAWLERAADCDVIVAAQGMALRPGNVVLAPPDHDLTIDAAGRCSLAAGDSTVAPRIDVLLRSVALSYGSAAIGVLLTGMGEDGARGLRVMRDRGALTIAQDRQTSAVYGMPAAAARADAATAVLPLEQIAVAINDVLQDVAR